MSGTDTTSPSDVADRYRRLSRDFARLLDGVPDDGWDAPTPCSDWTVRDLVDHVTGTQGIFRGLVGRANPADIRRVAEVATGFGDAMRSPGAFGPEVEAPEDADEQERLLAFLGRNTR